MKKLTAPVLRVTMMIRLKRHLKRTDELLKTSRSAGEKATLGAFYLVSKGRITQKDVDPVKLARERDVLKPWEVVSG